MTLRALFHRFHAPEGDGGQGGGTPPPPAPPPSGNAPPLPPPPPPPPGITWLPGADEATTGYVQNKGWQGPADVLTGYRSLETMLGADRAGRTVVLPTDENDAPAMSKVYDRLGRPANPAEYKLPVPDGQDGAFATAASAKFHEVGLTAKQGQALATWWNEQQGGAATRDADAERKKFETEDANLTQAWGAERPMRTELARRAAQEVGWTAEQMTAIEKAVGFSGVLKGLAKIGDMLRENGADGLTHLGSLGMTPEGARSRRTQLMADPQWRARAQAKDSAEWAEMQRLDKIIASTMQ